MAKPAAVPFSLLFIFILPVMLFTCRQPEEKITLSIAAGAVGKDLELTVSGVQRFMELNPNIRVLIRPVPHANAERREMYLSLLERESGELDVLLIDVVWIGVMAKHALDLNTTLTREQVELYFPSAIRNNTVDNRLIGVPLFIDVPGLFYRVDLLEKYKFNGPPTTWDELEEMSARIAEGERSEGNLGFYGYLWQGSPYEGLTCNALEWQFSAGGGNFLDLYGKPNLLNPRAVAAMKRAGGWIGTISPPQVLQFDEDDSRLMWQKGNAAFLRNWSYVYALAQQDEDISGKFAVGPLPTGSPDGAGVLGGWQLMVSRYSRHPVEAAKLVAFLAGVEEQKRRAIEGSYSPSIRVLYSDPEVLASVPFFEGYDRVLEKLIVRPSTQTGEKYVEISRIYYEAVHEILKGGDAEAVLKEAEARISRLLENRQQPASGRG